MNNLKISHKLNLGFALVILVFLITAATAAWQVEKVSRATSVMERSSELLKIASAWQGDVRQNSARSLAVGFSDGNACWISSKKPWHPPRARPTRSKKPS